MLGIALVLSVGACGAGDAEGPGGASVAPDELGDGRHFGQVTALDPGRQRLAFDPAVLDGAVVDDPDDRTAQLAVADDVEVRLLDPCCELAPASFASWLDGFVPDERTFYATSLSYYWITVADGEVVAVDEHLLAQ